VIWTLDPDTRPHAGADGQGRTNAVSRLLECSQCKAIRTAASRAATAASCRSAGEYVVSATGTGHLDRDGRHHPNSYSIEEKLNSIGLPQLALIAATSPAPPLSFRDRLAVAAAHLTNFDRRNPRRVAPGDRHCRITRKVDAEGGRRG
jgi:ribosomal protein S27E